jgi:excisionase family DNA binding protein
VTTPAAGAERWCWERQSPVLTHSSLLAPVLAESDTSGPLIDSGHVTPAHPYRRQQLAPTSQEEPARGPDMTSNSNHPQLLTIDQLAQRLGITVRHVRRLVADKRVPYYKVGRLVRFDPAEITDWLATRRVP